MPKTYFLGFLALCLAATGCSMLLTQPKSTTSTPEAQRVPDGDYFPLKAGSIWVMKPFGRSLAGLDEAYNRYAIGSSTMSIESVETASDALIARATSTTRRMVLCGLSSDCPPFADRLGTLLLTKEPSGKMLLSAVPSASFDLPGDAELWRFIYPEGLRYASSSVAPRVPYVELPRVIGELSLEASASAASGYTTYRFSEVQQSSALEPEVVVSAGRFTNCLKLVVTSTTYEDFQAENQPLRSSHVAFETIYWLAEGVGIVKKQHTYAPSYRNIPYVFEEELATYSIPQ